jgi:hypothetical protein
MLKFKDWYGVFAVFFLIFSFHIAYYFITGHWMDEWSGEIIQNVRCVK